MTAKNKPTYELFCKGIMNKSRKGVRFDADGNVIVEPKAEFGSDVEVDGQLTINSASDLKTKDGTGFASKSDLSNLATKEELNAKQSTLYRHTVTIYNFAGSEKILLVMTHDSKKNLAINSVQDLIEVFKGTSLSCTCTRWTMIHISDEVDDIYINNVAYSKINIGNSLAEITLDTAEDLEEYSFTDVFGTSDFTISDTVTAM